MIMEELKKQLNYDGAITYGKGVILLSLPEDLHNWVMGKIQGSKWQRGGFIRSQLRILKEGQLIYSETVMMQKPRTKTPEEMREEIEAETRKLKEKVKARRKKKVLNELTSDERIEWERQERLEQYQLEKAKAELDLAADIKSLFKKQQGKEDDK